jgi:hypothetical protein
LTPTGLIDFQSEQSNESGVEGVVKFPNRIERVVDFSDKFWREPFSIDAMDGYFLEPH